MTAAILVARESLRARDDLIASRLKRFAWRHRAAVSSLAGRHERLADLALSFPALLFALAVPWRRFSPEPVIERVIAGAPLGELAATTHIPMWARKLGPEAFQRPLVRLPDSPMFRRQIANHWPASAKTASLWLETIASTTFWGHEGLAIWFARRIGSPEGREALSFNPLLSLWAWHAANPTAPASRLISTPWTPDMSVRQALRSAREWKDDVTAMLEMGDEAVADPWAERAVVDGYAFEPILTATDLIENARRFNNCARTYCASIAAGSTRLWIVRRNGEPVAMLNLGAAPIPTLSEISGPSNADVSPEIALAAHRWLRGHSVLRIMPEPRYADVAQRLWINLWKPYWLAKRRLPSWLPLRPVRNLYRWLDAHRGRRRRRRRP